MTIRFSLVALVMTLVPAVLAQSPAPAPKPSAETRRLEMLVGKWTIDGQAQTSPYGPAGKLSSTDTYEWMPGGFFMAHRWDAVQGGAPIIGMEVMAYDGHAREYTTHFFDNLGNSGVYRGMVQGNTWTWRGDTEVGGKPLKERCTTTVTPPNALTSKCDYSTDGIKWLPNFELKGTRAK